jgi:hypothetical protein
MNWCREAAEELRGRHCFERARLHSLLKNSLEGAVLKGHELIRAAKPHRINGALAAEGWFSSLFAIQSGSFRTF